MARRVVAVAGAIRFLTATIAGATRVVGALVSSVIAGTCAARRAATAPTAVRRRQVRIVGRSAGSPAVHRIVPAAILDRRRHRRRRLAGANRLELVAGTRIHHAAPAAAIRIVVGIIVDHDAIVHAGVVVRIPDGIRPPVMAVVAEKARIRVRLLDAVGLVVERVRIVDVVEQLLREMTHRHVRVAMHRAPERVIVPRRRLRIAAQLEPLRAHDREHVAESRIVVGVEARVVVPVEPVGATALDPIVVVWRTRKEHRDPAVGVDARDRHVAVVGRAVGRAQRFAAAYDAAAREPEVDLRLAVLRR